MLTLKSKIAVLGLGVEGKDTINYLQKKGINDITVFDKKTKSDLDLSGINTSDLKFITGADYLKTGLTVYKTIFRSPGVYRFLPEIITAEKSGSVITSNIKLFFEKFNGVSIGVTGTKGKGTTCTLIYEMLKKSGKNVYLTGNIGSPPLSVLDEVGESSVVVLELSSFQLIDLQKSPDIAVVLNVTSDHMDWHKNQKEYVDAKKNIVKQQDEDDFKVINFDYKTSKDFADLSPSKNYFFSKNEKVVGGYVENGVIYLKIEGKLSKIGNTKDLLLRGKHNWENVCAAACTSYLAGADLKSIEKTVFSFKGLEHRLELVGEVDGVKYYNDSFSTNPQTTIAAVDSFFEPTTLIIGGYDKGLDFNQMAKHLSKTKNLKNILLIGDLEDKLYELLKKYKSENLIIRMGKPGMSQILEKCKEVTKKGGVVLLSPACASFGMFENYKERGNQFKKCVMNLIGS